MAAVDYLYGFKADYDELYDWCKQNRSDLLPHFTGWRPNQDGDGLQHRVACFSEADDMWLLENCPIGWVVEAIRDQYGYDENDSTGKVSQWPGEQP
jgi:hypothetical protein